MVQTSYEGRWFFEGGVPAEVVRKFWSIRVGNFTAEGLDESWPEQRLDHYLAFSRDMGVKVRNEPNKSPKLEFKGLFSRLGPARFGPNAVGFAETWVKWSYQDDEVPEELNSAVSEAVRTQAVIKRRVMRKIRLDAFQHDEEIRTDAFVDRGLQVELTRLELPGRGGRQHWTLSFEAFLMDANLVEDVQRNVGPFLAQMASLASVDLSLDSSRSYPEWLLELGA